MKNQHALRRLPFNAGDGSTRYCVMGEMTADASVDFQVPIDSVTDPTKLPMCADCSGELYWAEPTYGPGARRCVQCGSVYVVG
jgi:hypothetical protein